MNLARESASDLKLAEHLTGVGGRDSTSWVELQTAENANQQKASLGLSGLLSVASSFHSHRAGLSKSTELGNGTFCVLPSPGLQIFL